ncbi:RING finger protein 141-like [Hydractinia symbiolongicarpus]|uniref:RING finger protein 141-like n=1 Tax=Hydractinia symbiolongicarpus TaxID=13093 RepID=UPI00254FABF7|nr:RING finger protein 141-like [Hydractinia symbiolongicarpus]
MGQSIGQHIKNAIPYHLKNHFQKIHVEIKRDLTVVKKEFFLVKDVALIDYSSLRNTIAGLNTMLKSCCSKNTERVLFGLRSMEDEGVFWKALVKIVCFKVNLRDKSVTITRYMNIHQFWRLRSELLREIYYKELLDQNNDGFEIVQHPPRHDEDEAENEEDITSPLNVPVQLSVSTILERVNQVGNSIEQDECLICMDSKVEVSLPCAHSYCAKCISQWNIESPTCPTCREQIKTADEFWEIADMPNVDQMNKHLLEIATGT